MPTGPRSASPRRLRAVPAAPPPSTAPGPDDEALLAAVEQGRSGVGNALYERLIRVVDATLFRVVGRRDADHDDLVQAAFEQIVSTIARRKYARACNLNSWAAAVACNVAMNALRQRATRRRYVDSSGGADLALEHSPAAVDVEGQVRARESLERVRRHLTGMNPQRVEALLLHDMLGHELSEIAVLTGVSVAAAQSRLVRGRTELKKWLDEDTAFGTEDAE